MRFIFKPSPQPTRVEIIRACLSQELDLSRPQWVALLCSTLVVVDQDGNSREVGRDPIGRATCLTHDFRWLPAVLPQLSEQGEHHSLRFI